MENQGNNENTYAPSVAQPTVIVNQGHQGHQSHQGPVTDHQREYYGGWKSELSKGGIRVLSTIEIAVGCICVIFQIVLIVSYHLTDNNEINFSFVDGHLGTGIWCGAFFICTGAMGLVSINRRGLTWIVGFLTMNVISCSLLTWALLVITAISLGIVNEDVGRCHPDVGDSYFPSTTPRWTNKVTTSIKCTERLYSTSLALNSIMLLIAIMQFVVTMIAAIMSCCNTCCRAGTTQVRSYNHHQGVVHNGTYYGRDPLPNVTGPPTYNSWNPSPNLNQVSPMNEPQRIPGYAPHIPTTAYSNSFQGSTIPPAYSSPPPTKQSG